MTTAFSVFGSKAKLVKHYPAPRHETIIEPFAGGANYALHYWRHQVEIYDLNDVIIGAWKFLQREDALDWIRKLPVRPFTGQKVTDLTPRGAPPEMGIWLLAVVSRGSASSSSQARNTVTKFGAFDWPYQIRNVELVVKMIKHWKIKQWDYRRIKNKKATWFIDPPYFGKAGRNYIHGSHLLDYEELADWCRSRMGQVIVCEMRGATWLPFEPFRFTERMAKRREAQTYQEVILHRENS